MTGSSGVVPEIEQNIEKVLGDNEVAKVVENVVESALDSPVPGSIETPFNPESVEVRV